MSDENIHFKETICKICKKSKYLIQMDLFGKCVYKTCFYWEKYFKHSITLNFFTGRVTSSVWCQKYEPDNEKLQEIRKEENQFIGKTKVKRIYEKKEKEKNE